MIDIVNFLHQFVKKDKIHSVLSFGDELTCEREHNSQEDQRDAPTASKRFEGLVPCISDFHTFGNCMQVGNDLIFYTRKNINISPFLMCLQRSSLKFSSGKSKLQCGLTSFSSSV